MLLLRTKAQQDVVPVPDPEVHVDDRSVEAVLVNRPICGSDARHADNINATLSQLPPVSR